MLKTDRFIPFPQQKLLRTAFFARRQGNDVTIFESRFGIYLDTELYFRILNISICTAFGTPLRYRIVS